MTTDRRLLGTALALLSACCFGVMPVLTKVVYDGGADLLGVLAVRFAIAAAVLQVIARSRRQARPAGRTRVVLAGLGGVGYVGQALLFFSALQRIPAGLTTLLLYFYPALVVLLTATISRSRPRPLALVCVVTATAGTALTVGPVPGGQVLGVLLALSSALVYAVYIVVSGRVTDVAPLTMSAEVLTASAVVTGVLALLTRPQLPSSPSAWLALVGVALVGTVVAVTAFFAALALLGASDTAVLSTLEPVVSVLVAGLVLGERLSALQLFGGLVVVLAVAVLARSRPGDASVPA